ncbi:MAG: site-specific integrase [Candidatus Bathyarchaeia archaeon]
MFDLNPDKLIEEGRETRYSDKASLKEKFIDDVRDYVDQFIAECRKKDFTQGYIACIVRTVCSFFKHYRLDIAYTVKSGQITYHNRSIKKQEIKDILDHSSLRDKLFFKMMEESGLRPHTLVRLRYKHINDDYEKDIVPLCIDTPVNIIKGKYFAGRFTFIGIEAVRLLKQYLKPKETIDNEDLIFTSKKPNKMKGEVLSPRTFSNIFRRTARKLGIAKERNGKPSEIRLHCLRKYFRNYCKCDLYYIQFWMHHSLGSSDIHYISRDKDRHREEYTKAYPNLKIYEYIDSKEIDKIQQRNQILSDMYVDLKQEIKELSYMKLNRKEQLKDYLLSDEGREVLKELFKETIPVELYPMNRDS